MDTTANNPTPAVSEPTTRSYHLIGQTRIYLRLTVEVDARVDADSLDEARERMAQKVADKLMHVVSEETGTAVISVAVDDTDRGEDLDDADDRGGDDRW